MCKNNCVVYYDVNANKHSCLACGLSKWKVPTCSKGRNNIPHKILHYFPLKHRLHKLFTSPKIIYDMQWREAKITNDDLMRHPANTIT